MSTQPPNIIFCHVDQLTYDTLSSLGDPWVHTPNIDRIRAEGMSFEIAQGAYPVCCPARTSWYTGRMSSEHGTWDNAVPIREDMPDLGHWLRERSYDCYYAGKWHLVDRDVADCFIDLYPHRPFGEKDDPHVAQTATAFIAQRPADGNPFFLNLGFQNPHDICYTSFGSDNTAMKVGMNGELEGKLPDLPPTYDPDKPLAAAASDSWGPDELRLHNYYYYRMIEMVDQEIGRVYDALADSPFRDNTLFIFSADHGEMMGHHNHLRKGLLYEESLRVPLTFVWPGHIEAGVIDTQHCASGVDVTATILDYAGAEPMPGMRVARSLRPFLEGKDTDWREYTPAETVKGGVQNSFRDERFKSIFNFERKAVELYDYRADPNETKNLARDPAYADVLERHLYYIEDYNTDTVEWSDFYTQELKRRNVVIDRDVFGG
ncbi:sulfatase-like hydrolase/transferase [Ruficoccus amylovorans]|uniref:Sulfatase-like hydrolase/transferase n=1 Tax=Ruficoccus amylovorans TaxID=1804625 RepID=A0A842HCZ9_9BACT|nr:sulfatase-like hydrolase/transferase [Ruficoccus amylovorans]MBC2593467.1 sulfatase-like hydrolase/transferase [Ruficoccus amylovorans]